MKTLKQLIFAFILFFAFSSMKAQNTHPTLTGKMAAPRVLNNPVAEKEVALTSIQKPVHEQVIDNANMKKRSENSTKADAGLTPEQKKKRDEDSAKAKMVEMTKNSQGAIEVGGAVIQ